MGTAADSHNLKQAVLMRYPFAPFEEISRQLIVYKTFRGNKRIFKAMAIMDELIDYAALDPDTHLYTYQLTKDQLAKKTDSLILIPRELVMAFKVLYHGGRKDGEPAFKSIAPHPNMNPRDNFVVIRDLITFKRAWGESPNPYIVYVAGYAYTVQITNDTGFTVSHHIPMVDWNNPDIDTYMTNSIPFYQWAEMYDGTWRLLAPICTMIEKIIAKALFDNNIKSGASDDNQDPGPSDDGAGEEPAESAEGGDEELSSEDEMAMNVQA